MRTRAIRIWAVGLSAVLAVGAGVVQDSIASASPTGPTGSTSSTRSTSSTTGTVSPATHPARAVCAPATRPRAVTCMAVQRTDVSTVAGVIPQAAPAGYGPAALQDAYDLPSATAGAGQVVAIVDAFDDPTAEADLTTYRAQFGLPPCTTANGCFRKVDQRGGTDYPASDSGWAGEISLDLDMVSAICPNCGILLVEGDEASLDSLAKAVDQAVAMGAKYVSNSYGSQDPGEDPSFAAFDADYTHPGVAITASTGDNGFGTSYPASSTYVTAVGGTSLSKDGSARGWAESAWTGAGSGCSIFADKPAWQVDTGCARHAVGDVSAVADPNTGVAVYDTFQAGGWNVFGGTSVAAPVIASVYALAGPPSADIPAASYPYDAEFTNAGGINDVTTGSNGTCAPAYLCTAQEGFDGPTGLGTPSGVDAFRAHPHGTITGTVTDSGTHEPITGATITVGGRTVHTDVDGHYDLSLPTGEFPVSASERLYQPQTADLTVTAGASSTHDFALTPVPRATLSGVVADASGHGWPLYASVAVSDRTDTFTASTDPVTGRYSVVVPQNTSYTVHVTAADGGYDPNDQRIEVATADVSQDFGLTAAVVCTAAGYHADMTGTAVTFDGTKMPRGWRVTDTDHNQPGYDSGPEWTLTDPGGRANQTGGTGGFAIVDSDHAGQHSIQDTVLTSPTVDLSDASAPAVQFDNDLRPAVNSTATVDVSTDGGTTWSTVWRRAGFSAADRPGRQVVLLPQAAHQARVRVRFHYVGSWSQWWAIDDVTVGDRRCDAVSGGLVVGQVTDASTGAGILGATVTSDSDTAKHGTTVARPADPGHSDGVYWLFTTGTGEQSFTASASGHLAGRATGTVTADQVTRVDFALDQTSTP